MTIARATIAFLLLIAMTSLAPAASGKQPAPAGALTSAPPEYTHFTVAEFQRGFLALAFGSDLRIGAQPRGIRRFDRPIRAHVFAGGSVARTEAMKRIVEEYAGKVPNLHLSLTPDRQNADIEIRLIDEKDFKAALRAAFGAKVARISSGAPIRNA